MANVTDEHDIRHHVEALIRAAVKANAKIPRSEARASLRSHVEALRENTERAIADGRLVDAAAFLADFGRRALASATEHLPAATDYDEGEAARDDALLAESALGPT